MKPMNREKHPHKKRERQRRAYGCLNVQRYVPTMAMRRGDIRYRVAEALNALNYLWQLSDVFYKEARSATRVVDSRFFDANFSKVLFYRERAVRTVEALYV